MLLSELAKPTAHTLYGSDVEVGALCYNSRKVQPGDVFCCVTGTFADGHAFAKQAIDAGAAALVVEHRLPFDIAQVQVENTRVAMAEMAAALHGYPARSMCMIGVTGTNGKTSVTYMLKAILERMGKKVGLIGTIRNMIGARNIETERTTPDSVDLQEILATMRDEGVEVVVMEVSSHSLDQRRVHGIHFDYAVFTNLSQDHLDYHKSFENYFAAKKKLFENASKAILNADDAYVQELIEGLHIPYTTFGVREKADLLAADIDISTRGVQFDVYSSAQVLQLRVPIPGLFSVFNALAAAAVALELGADLEVVRDALYGMHSVSGRLEPLPTNGRGFSVLLDYAHTPDALENVLKTVRGFCRGRLLALFGCGGNRDHAKRPIMGEIAGRYADLLIVTSDNPRGEDPMEIIESILEGVKKSGCEYVVIENRREAIAFALEHARKDDIVLLAGKGHETYQEINGGRHHFDEKEIVAELLQ